MNEQPGTGAILTLDVRDYPYATAAVPEVLPTSYRTDTSMFPVLMQGKRSSCVSHAWVRLLQLYWWKKTGKVIDFSPRFLHAYTSPGMADSDGRDPRVVGQVLTDIGCCTNALCPNDVLLDDNAYSRIPITQAMLDEAKQYKIPAYSFVNPDQYSIRHAIYHKGAVGLMFQVGTEWWTPSWLPQDINPLRPPHPVVSQHEVTGEHWTNILEGLENSWSDVWDEKGYAEYNLSNYAPLQVICIDDPSVDFNPSAPTQFKFNKDLYYGQTNPDIVQLQKRLGVIQTGYFGVLTRAAVVQYQKAHNIAPAVGYCGILTRTSLNNS